jgi:hypothetical protein
MIVILDVIKTRLFLFEIGPTNSRFLLGIIAIHVRHHPSRSSSHLTPPSSFD